MINGYKDLLVWQKAYELCLDIYKATQKYPRFELSVILSIASGLMLALSFPLFNFNFLIWFALLPLYFAVFCVLYNLLTREFPELEIIIIPLVWTALELIRSIGGWGFPAGLLSYSQYNHLFLIQISDIIGVFGLSFIIAFVNASIFIAFKQKSFNKSIKIITSLVIIFLVLISYGFLKIGENRKDANNLRIALIQPNLDFDAYDKSKAINILAQLTYKASQANPDIIIWPETSFKESIRLDMELSQDIYSIVKKSKTYLLLGSSDFKEQNFKFKRFNSAFLLSSYGEVLGQYNKIHPVLFWETFPIRYYLPFLKNTESKGRCDKGNDPKLFNMPKGNFSVLICFEGIFSDLSRKFVKNGAQFLVNITNDSWSKSSAEHYQHASMDVFRAIENRVYYIRVGNSGVTEVIDPYGKIVSSLPLYTKGYLIANISKNDEKTFYNRYGDLIASFSVFTVGIMIFFCLLKKGVKKLIKRR